MEHARRDRLEPYVTRDGSTIRGERAIVAGDWVAISLGTPHPVPLEGDG
jgi:hypothetical protein